MTPFAELVRQLGEAWEAANKFHAIHDNDPSNPAYEKADYCKSCWLESSSRTNFLRTSAVTIPLLIEALGRIEKLAEEWERPSVGLVSREMDDSGPEVEEYYSADRLACVAALRATLGIERKG